MEPDYGQSNQNGTPHIEVDDHYHYVVCERGHEFRRQSTRELDTLVYWIARDITHSMAFSPHVITHKDDEDWRRTAFRYWVDAVACLDAVGPSVSRRNRINIPYWNDAKRPTR
jgi:Immunity protein 63